MKIRNGSKGNGVMQRLLSSSYANRYWITIFTLTVLLALFGGVGFALFNQLEMTQEWKEILLLLIGAFIGSYQKVIDFWFNNIETDKELLEGAGVETGIYVHGQSEDRRKSGQPREDRRAPTSPPVQDKDC